MRGELATHLLDALWQVETKAEALALDRVKVYVLGKKANNADFQALHVATLRLHQDRTAISDEVWAIDAVLDRARILLDKLDGMTLVDDSDAARLACDKLRDALSEFDQAATQVALGVSVEEKK